MADSLLDRGQALLSPSYLTQLDGQVVQGHGEVGQVGIRVGFGEGAVAVGERLVDADGLRELETTDAS
ncbi:hypothetical protein [Streptomyces sp. NPDC059701]|uniref:hypothetical protein n=1 Tax=Streptomyces sp. NPDC059701 TaxID=3346914 RepID=UPI0036C4BF53